MKLMNLANIINYSLKFVIETSKTSNIDESHALKHSLVVLKYAQNIYKYEVEKHTYLKEQLNIICCSAIVHDMCDKKYMNEELGIINIQNYMKRYISSKELDVVLQIIKTMSYSKVIKNGYPNLGEYQLAYHIVREADLLSAYDIDRCLMYQMTINNNNDFIYSLPISIDLYENRVLNYINDNLYVSEYSKGIASVLHKKALLDLSYYKELYSTFL
jgi:hypothetical protein